MRRLIDLSHTIIDGLVTYPGLPPPRVTDFLSREASREHYAPGTTFHIARIEMVANTGTYLDAPSHRYAEGADLAALPLERVANLEGVVIDLTGGRGLPASALEGLSLRGRAVLVRSGWSRYFGEPAYANGQHPFVTGEAAAAFAAGGAALVGIDSLNIDDTEDRSRPAHSLLLAAGIPVVEHLTSLDQLPRTGFRFFAVPARFAGVGTFPVRAFAIV
ncbi:MAG TPA: cyclase family protein [Thermoanaerobaculia bacterium]|nr:cyclase family protein [Thermoanaerobaculia bacterium]